MSEARTTNLALEGIRGIACILVALGHTLYLTHLDPTTNLPEWLRYCEAGHSAVLIFFVLSGYLIGWTNSGDSTPGSRRAYLRRRFIRLAPIYYIALALTTIMILVRGDFGQKRAIVATFAGVQNFNDYFGWHLPPPSTNGPLWSLNYELLYYAMFIPLWHFRPRLFFVFAPALGATLLAWFTPQFMPLFIGSYACGWLFWAAGWWLARQPALDTENRAPVLTWLLLVVAGHNIGGLMRILNALHLHSEDAGMVTLADLAQFPVIILLLAAVARRQLPFARSLSVFAWLICIIPLGGMLWTGKLWTHPGWMVGGATLILAIFSAGLRNNSWLQKFDGVGRISYAFYVVHFPLLFLVQLIPSSRGTIPSYLFRIAVWAVLSVTLSWYLERRFQPWIKSRLRAPGIF